MFITVSFAESHGEEHKYTILLCFLPRAKARECCERVCFGGWDLGVGSSLQEKKKKKGKRSSPFPLLSAWLKTQLKVSYWFVGLLTAGSTTLNFGCCPAPRKNNVRVLNWPQC